MKRAEARQFDSLLPRVTFEYFVRYEAGANGRVTWEVKDCGEQAGDPQAGAGRDFPLCVQATASMAGGRLFLVSASVGTFRSPDFANPVVRDVVVVEPTGESEQLRTLSDLPAALQKKKPWSRDLRDLLPPLG